MAESTILPVFKGQSCIDDGIAETIMQGIGELSDEDTFSDFDVIVEGKLFRCHRILLSSMSRYFRALCTSGRIEDRRKSVTLLGLTAATFRLVLDVITKARDVVDTNNFIDLWHAANQLDMPLLLKRCEDFALSFLSTGTCFKIFHTAKLLDCDRVTKQSWQFILEHFEALRHCKDLLDLPYPDFKRLVESRDLNAKNEDHVIDVILKWVHQPLEQVEEDGPHSSQNDEVREIDDRISHEEGHSREHLSESCQNADQVSDPSTRAALKSRRTDYLPDLLWAARICLVSGKAIRKLLDHDLVVKNKLAFSCIKLGVSFQTEGKGYCPPQALRRATSRLQSGIIYLDKVESTIKFMDSDLKTFYFQNIPDIQVKCGIFIDGNFFFTDSRNVYCSSIFKNDVINVQLEMEEMDEEFSIMSLAAVDGCVYLICTTKASQVVKRFTAMEATANAKVSLEDVGEILVHNMVSPTAAVLGANIIVFGKDSTTANTIVASGFNTTTSSPFPMDAIEESSSSVVTFEKEDELFFLFSSGSMWKVSADAGDRFSMQKVTTLWDFNRDLRGAVLFNDELFIFGNAFSSANTCTWQVSVEGVFYSVRNMDTRGNCFHHAVMPKTVLQNKKCPAQKVGNQNTFGVLAASPRSALQIFPFGKNEKRCI